MDLVKDKRKKGLIIKTWERCRSIGGSGSGSSGCGVRRALMMKSKSWPRMISSTTAPPKEENCARTRKVAPEGCFSVYVGPEKQRFVIKTEYINHPLFKMLLEEAELEYGFNSEGPLALPCDVDFFYKVLVEMDDCDREIRQVCGFARSHSSYRLLSRPSRLVAMNEF